MRRAGRRMMLLLLLSLPFASTARAADPVLKAGRDPGGVAVALLVDGVDYREPDVAGMLARDGEGEAIAFDAVDGDHRPFVERGHGTEAMRATVRHGGVRVVAVRVDFRDPRSVAKGIAFAAATPAKIVVAAGGNGASVARDVLASAAQNFPDMLFLASASGLASDAHVNLVLLPADGLAVSAVEAVALVFGCSDAALAASVRDRTAFLARLRRQQEAGVAGCDAARGGAQGKKP